ncbi:MAG: hypothetical protein AAFX09_02825 [Pseudomonadota bacterium]
MAELMMFAHLLVLVYWLGGDLGAFYASSILVDEKQPAPARMAAAKVVANVDMAPRMALIFAFPTGYSLAISIGWLAAPGWTAGLAWGGALAWAVLAWMLHLKKGPQDLFKQFDLIIRFAAIAGLVLGAVAALTGMIDAPVFLALKWLILGAAIVCGLIIRAGLAPFFPAIGALAAGRAGDEENALIRSALGRVKVFVLIIWGLVISAALLGVYTPDF